MSVNLKENPRGSIWHRWEPHIHTPGTVLNSQYSATNDGWDDFIHRIDTSDPIIKALGITDYLTLASYKKTVAHKVRGRLPSVDLVFPNIELRFDTGTGRNVAINGHLMVCPDDPEHVQMAERFLNKLTFSARDQKYSCNRNDLILLGRAHKGDNTLDDNSSLKEGTKQFKVNFDQLLENFRTDKWAAENILLAIAVNSSDGTSGLSNDASFAAMRKSMERNSHIMFSSHESQRLFWLGKGVDSKEKITSEYGNCKPCIHGSDAHKNENVGIVHDNRYTWIKGDLGFESLRQICLEPEDRVFIGQTSPGNSVASRTINQVSVNNASWMMPSGFAINPGLVAVIGARGSGKTALADMIAAGGNAVNNQLTERSFIQRAREFLFGVSVKLSWGAGATTSCNIDEIEVTHDSPRVQYLSQQFVDKLCSAEGVSDELLSEVERVIFTSHPESDRLGLPDFNSLLEFRASNARDLRIEGESSLADLSTMIARELGKINLIDSFSRRIEEKSKLIETDKVSRQGLIVNGQNDRVELLQKVSEALEAVSKRLDMANRKTASLTNLKNAVRTGRSTSFPAYSSKLQQNHAETGLTSDQWDLFKIDYIGDVDTLLEEQILASKSVSLAITGNAPLETNISARSLPFISDYENLESKPYNSLKNEIKRLGLIIGIDTSNTQQYNRLNVKIGKEEAELEKLKRELEDARGAAERMKKLLLQKKAVYKNIFDAILQEEEELSKLYQPLMSNLTDTEGTLNKLSFHVRRTADTNAWADIGEQLLDMRKVGDFRGKGTLLKAVDLELKFAWEKGNSEQIAEALSNFRNKYDQAIKDHAPVEKSDQGAYNEWAVKMGEWLYSTKHISIKYGIQYDGVDIQQLSPGTRGIVLLLLYLAVDKEDDRPLIIDQPEENLDPKSIFKELVPLFISVKRRRQVIIVTHNANLVVNTDADQVIIATGGDHRPGQLPEISYKSGGLENETIRHAVCEILEGGEDAFKERAKRLRVSFSK